MQVTEPVNDAYADPAGQWIAQLFGVLATSMTAPADVSADDAPRMNPTMAKRLATSSSPAAIGLMFMICPPVVVDLSESGART